MMKYEYIGTSPKEIHLADRVIALKGGEVFESEQKIDHPQIIPHIQRKSGGKYDKVNLK